MPKLCIVAILAITTFIDCTVISIAQWFIVNLLYTDKAFPTYSVYQ